MLPKLNTFRYPYLSGIFIPFKIWCSAGLKIRSGTEIKLAGRLTIGSPDNSSAVVSRLPANIYFGKNSKITAGHSVSIGPGVTIIVKDNASLTIGNGTYFTSDLHLEVVHSLKIGDFCAISWGVTIIDGDHHQLLYNNEARPQKNNSVSIGNKVWIGCNATILKNTMIGNNCVIAAGSIVSGTFPDHSLIAGNPAKVIKQNVSWY